MKEYSIVEHAPTVKEYQVLRTAVGWGEADEGAIEESLRNSLYWVCILKTDV